ncbi:hypothetical protein SADUNF_Sadunf19G0053700 [Salix dunnii]|uniref:Uncharacterized protein n=1 Tax=Salix dunnii TaxID=1413687 RepID=A0A835J3E0_9ROSI|nr:hypothetical protein SADUNF_Sadunf19G0053700 [Salix dunnii]
MPSWVSHETPGTVNPISSSYTLASDNASSETSKKEIYQPYGGEMSIHTTSLLPFEVGKTQEVAKTSLAGQQGYLGMGNVQQGIMAILVSLELTPALLGLSHARGAERASRAFV